MEIVDLAGSDQVAVQDQEHLAVNITNGVLDVNLFERVPNQLFVVVDCRLVAEYGIGPSALEQAPGDLRKVNYHMVTYLLRVQGTGCRRQQEHVNSDLT